MGHGRHRRRRHLPVGRREGATYELTAKHERAGVVRTTVEI